MKMVGKIACFALLCMVVVAPHAKAALTCSQVQAALVRCLPYLTNHGPLGGCCGAFQAIWGAAKTPQDRRTACSCTKSAANAIKAIDYGKAAALPGVCHVNVPFKISLSIDCSKIQ